LLAQVPVGGGATRRIRVGLSPFKVYHDLRLAAGDCRAAYGPCLEPALAEMGLVADLLLPATADRSPPLPWFDKMRYLRHGTLRLRCRQLRLALLNGHDPHVSAQALRLSMADVAATWRASHLQMDGAAVRYAINMPGKFDGCPLLEIPLLRYVHAMPSAHAPLPRPHTLHARTAFPLAALPEAEARPVADSLTLEMAHCHGGWLAGWT